MGCEGIRETLSARLDGADSPGEGAAADTHLAECRACQRWFDDAAAVTRMIRTGPAVIGPDVTEAVLAAAPGRARARVATVLRMMVGVLGAAQLTLGVMQIIAFAAAVGHSHQGAVVNGATLGHLWHESAAWNVAVGAGFLWIATRRGRPAGIIPILTAFVVALALLSAGDIIAGRVEAARLASHAFVFTGYLIILALSRPSLSVGDPPGARVSAQARVKIGARPGAAQRLPRPLRSAPAPEARYRDAA